MRSLRQKTVVPVVSLIALLLLWNLSVTAPLEQQVFGSVELEPMDGERMNATPARQAPLCAHNPEHCR